MADLGLELEQEGVSRSIRRGHDVEAADFLPDVDSPYWDRERPVAMDLRAVYAALAAWLGTLAACRARPRSWDAPDDQDTPLEPLAVLTPIQPHAPCPPTSWEALAA